MQLKYSLNNIVALILLTTVIVMEFHISSQQFFGPGDYYPKENSYGYALTNFVYESFCTASYATCLLACEADMSCMSLNFLMTTSTCDLNSQTNESTPGYLKERDNSIYSNPFGRTKSKRGTKTNPAKSCLEILKSNTSTGSREYWLDPNNTGTPIQAFCDMTTDGGGWTVIKRLVQPSNTKLYDVTKNTLEEVIRDYDRTDVNVIPMGAAMLDIKKKMGFDQIHFYCRKVSVGRVVSIMTRNDTLGQAVVSFFTNPGVATTFPAACGSFDTLPDDTSIISQECNKWAGNERDATPIPTKTWGAPCCPGGMRIVRPFQIAVQPSRAFEFVSYFVCDNNLPLYANQAVAPDVNDTWQISVR